MWQASVADTRDAIIVSWNSEELPYGDARFVVEMCKESQDEDVGDGWTTVAETTESSYMYPATEPGTYEFRVGGKVGSDGEVTYCEQDCDSEGLPSGASDAGGYAGGT